jgi:hypothetical protein
MSIGTEGVAGTVVNPAGAPLEGAVRGRLIEMRLSSPLFPASPSFWREACFLRHRCSQCFAVSCLLPGAENVFLVVADDM